MTNSVNNENSNVQLIKTKAAKGAVALFFRQIAVQIINVIGNILLARLLLPKDFGVYAIISFVINSFAIFGDIGLGASLIQRKNNIIEKELNIVFTFQLLMSVIIILLIFISSPYIVNYYNLGSDSKWLIRTMSLLLIFGSFRAIPALKLERDLEFAKLAKVEVIETLSFQGIAVCLAFIGMGIWSFIVAVLARSIIGVVTIYYFVPWKIGLNWNVSKIKELMKFGLPYQGAGTVSFIKDAITPLLVGKLAGATDVGYINWASIFANYPALVLKIMERVTFPMFSRIQDSEFKLITAIEKIIRINCLVVYCLASLMVALIPEITKIIFTSKWDPAIIIVYLLSLSNLFVPIAQPITSMLNALGKSAGVFKFALFWSILTWLFGYPLVLIYGTLGYAIAVVLVLFTNIPFFIYAKKFVSFNIIKNIFVPLMAGFVTLSLIIMIKKLIIITNIFNLAATGLVGIFIYILTILLLSKNKFFEEAKNLIKIAKSEE